MGSPRSQPPACACGAPTEVYLCPSCYATLLPAHAAQQHVVRVLAGLARARAAGKTFGRPRSISDEKLAAIRQALAGGMSKARVCRVFKVKRTTHYDALARTST